MITASKISCRTVLAAAAVLASVTSLVDADVPKMLMVEKGSITGTISMPDGTPANACPIKFFLSLDPGAHSSGFKVPRSINFLQGSGRIIASAVSDAKGKFEVKSVNAGKFSYMAGSFKLGLGGGEVTVEEGKAATVEVKLDPPVGK